MIARIFVCRLFLLLNVDKGYLRGFWRQLARVEFPNEFGRCVAEIFYFTLPGT